MLNALLFAAALAASGDAPPPQEIAPGVTLIAGEVPSDGRGPDGNTIVFEAREGFVVVDTGRHAEHADAILAFADARHRPIVAIINTHWHLDHSSGNRRLKAVFPHATLFATSAVDRALGPEGFLTRNYAAALQHMNVTDASETQRGETMGFIETMQASESLRPDVVLSTGGAHRFGGRRLQVHITDGAVADADVWLYDPRTHVAVLGDLVTLPAPFFETACPQRWRAALDHVWETPFIIAIPGHGAPMRRTQFDIYRTAFGALLDCVSSDAEASVCATAWTQAITPIASASEAAQAPMYARYYVDLLRQNGGKSPDCLTR